MPLERGGHASQAWSEIVAAARRRARAAGRIPSARASAFAGHAPTRVVTLGGVEDPSAGPPPRSILLGATGLGIEGGIACVTRSIARALDEEIEHGRLERSDRVLLLDEAPPPVPRRGEQALARGSRRRFAWQLWRGLRR